MRSTEDITSLISLIEQKYSQSKQKFVKNSDREWINRILRLVAKKAILRRKFAFWLTLEVCHHIIVCGSRWSPRHFVLVSLWIIDIEVSVCRAERKVSAFLVADWWRVMMRCAASFRLLSLQVRSCHQNSRRAFKVRATPACTSKPCYLIVSFLQ